jgi:proteasome lid subunit RPN8/RPN11
VILEISETLIGNILAAATRAHPKECCGLIEGMRTKNGWRALALHETKNLAVNGAREFLIDPEAQFRLLHGLRGTGREIIGCFHSHPNSSAAPSATDRASAGEDGFLWLIAGGSEEIAAFVYREQEKIFSPVSLERTGT